MNEKLQRGLTAARVGDISEARRLFREVTTQEPNNAEAWLALAGVVEGLTDKKDSFEQVLKLEPDHQEAQAALEVINQKLAAQTPPDRTILLPSCCQNSKIGLRCNKCDRPICSKCAQRTPVGYRCIECIREQEDKFYTGTNNDYVIAAAVSFPLSLLAMLLIMFLSQFGLFALFIIFFVAPAIAGGIAEAVRRAVSNRRSRYLAHTVAGALVLAALPFVAMFLLSGYLFGIIAPGLFIFLGVTTVMARLR